MAIHVGNKIRQLIEVQPDVSNRKLAEKLGMTEVNLYKILKKEDLSTELLKKVADVLGVPISWFFTEDAPGVQVANGTGIKQLINSQLHEKEHAELEKCRQDLFAALKRESELKDRIIQLLEKK